MNRYFRAIGLSERVTVSGMQTLINQVLSDPVYRAYTTNSDKTLLAEFRTEYGKGFGVSVVGEFDDDDKFRYSYCYPYVTSDIISTEQQVTIEPRLSDDMFAGVCDDLKVGTTIIFRLQNVIDCVKDSESVGRNVADLTGKTCMLAALSTEGTIMLPVAKTPKDIQIGRRKMANRTRLMRKAMNGDDDAMQDLTMQDMDTYAAISHQLQTQDVYTIVDTYFMPFGVECDLYSVMGEIEECEKVVNNVTDETLYRLLVDCNNLRFIVLINSKDLFGVPAVGRRFKGIVWMQGSAVFSDDTNEDYGDSADAADASDKSDMPGEDSGNQSKDSDDTEKL